MRMTVTTNTGSLIATYAKRIESLTPNVLAAEEATLASAKAKAVQLSSGTGYKIGRDRGYPYARHPKAGNPPLPGPPSLVNVQSGVFRASWHAQVRPNADGLVSELSNDAPYAVFFNGQPTRSMIGRPILQEVFKALRPERIARLRTAVSLANRGVVNWTAAGATATAGGGSGGGAKTPSVSVKKAAKAASTSPRATFSTRGQGGRYRYSARTETAASTVGRLRFGGMPQGRGRSGGSPVSSGGGADSPMRASRRRQHSHFRLRVR